MGLEWLWRIKEEPYLWRRYAHDASALAMLILKNVLPLTVLNGWYNRQGRRRPKPLAIQTTVDDENATFYLSGDAVREHVAHATARVRETIELARKTSLSTLPTFVISMPAFWVGCSCFSNCRKRNRSIFVSPLSRPRFKACFGLMAQAFCFSLLASLPGKVTRKDRPPETTGLGRPTIISTAAG